MKTLIFFLLLIPSLVFSQTSYVFIKLSDAKGNQIIGDSNTRGFERAIRGLTTASSGKNNTQFDFTMPVTGAAATLKSALANREQLLNAMVYVLTPNPSTGALQYSYTITMQDIRVIYCAESMGCNNMTTTGVSLVATRIGWTYYTTDRSGNAVVSQKYGFDSQTGGAWSNF